MKERSMEWRLTHPCVKWCNDKCMATGDGITDIQSFKKKSRKQKKQNNYVAIWCLLMCYIFQVDHSILGIDECRALALYETDLYNENKTNRNNLRIQGNTFGSYFYFVPEFQATLISWVLLYVTWRWFSARINVVIRHTISLSDFLLS